ncbi:LOB domain-containing protein [Arachis hypogaea]|nr:LOB domain-containing protein [Arachis hypogaea]
MMVEEESRKIESDVLVETATVQFPNEPDSDAKGMIGGLADVCGNKVGLELSLGLELVSREHHVVVPLKKRRIDFKDFCGGITGDNGAWMMETRLQFQAFNGSILT